jgi:EXLDI family protein
VPNKTIYVSEGDLPLYRRAQELAGDNLSAAITTALRRYVDVEEGRGEGFDEFTVRVGVGRGRRVRFTGVLLGEWARSASGRMEHFRVYRSRTGKYVVHTERSPGFEVRDAQGRSGGWRAHLGLGDASWGASAGVSTLDVVESLDELRERIPPELFDLVSSMGREPAIEDLDI